ISDNQTTKEVTHKLLIKDHLGSTLAVSEVSSNGNNARITQAFRYDPFGQQYALQASKFEVFTGYMRQGFTGHEMLNNLNVIHMNGRIYDPTLGRFLQADPHIQAPTNSQSYNRYSYVLNNPLSYTDPSGYFFKSLFKKLNKALGDFAPLLGIALLAIPGVREWTLASGWHAALFGFGTGGVATGSLKGALIGAFSGAAFHHIGGAFTEASGFFAEGGFGHIITHGVTGGITSVLSGGKFGHGFFSAGFSKFAMSNAGFNYNDISSGAIIGRTVIAGIVGGTASKISGGKFGNGAATAAMAQLFNQETSNYKNVTAQRPYSEDFWEEYLNYDDYDTAAAWETVGGSLDDGYGPYSNSCATRVSHGLNQSGAPIPRGAPGANLNFGGDNGGLRYILSARQLEVYLADAWGTPDFSNVTVEQLSSLRTSMAPNQVAIGVSPDHATVLTNSYSDKYWGLASGGSVWILPTKSN
ncbi:T6SS effector amidase Tae4 family protein, partial [Pseudoalteromonas piscicida]|uniref:T6SS effector amidase Tae4 family protein n=1 Tax=Pseudoalteromonas piscicida TaxID=43662 RepID=UPI0024135D2A